MIKKYISKFTIDIAPSIIATIVGAYIVNHYINPKSDDQKPAAAMAAMPNSKPADKTAAIKPADLSSDVANILDAAPDKAQSTDKTTDKPVIDKANIDKAGTDKPEAAPEARRHTSIRDRAAAKAPAAAAPAPVATASIAPVPATVGAAPAEASVDDRRDANDLARAAIERLNREQPRSQEAARAAPQQVQPMQQLPPPIVLATPSVESFGQPQGDRSDSRRLRPPGEIPAAFPVDLQADASPVRRDRTNVAEDVLSAAKSVFHSVTRPFDR
ncbi:MAG: cell envelope biogenesis protein TolA [Tardiphaga sp.]